MHKHEPKVTRNLKKLPHQRNKSPEIDLEETEIYGLSDNAFRVKITKVLNKFRKMLHE